MADPNFADKTIWTGDNLDILRGMNSECVDLIYLDPPFNSNRDYAAPIGSKAAGAFFEDTWTLSKLDEAWMGIVAEAQPAVANLLHASRLTHGKGMQSYLTMMAVRLLEMRRVLKDTGSIYLHCDPTASHYLKMLMDAVFGAGRFASEVVWRKYGGHKNTASRKFTTESDTILYYVKGDSFTFNKVFRPLSEATIRGEYKHIDADGRRYAVPRGRKYRDEGVVKKVYLDEHPGVAVGNLWSERGLTIQGHDDERTGYPTQKPMALLERIIKASTNEGDLVLDPFCGCATACVAAENLGRRWAGIDISPKAVELVNMRLQRAMGSLFHNRYVTPRTDIPRRTDVDAPKDYRQNKHVLFGRQEGLCAGCKVMFPFRNFTIDHVVPQSRGGTDHLDNLQLLCGACNSLKGNRDQAYLIARLKEMGV